MNERKRAAFVAAGLALVTAQTAHAQVVKLAVLERQAQHAQPSLTAADARIAAARARISIAAAAAYPTLTAGATFDMVPGSYLVNIRDEAGRRYIVQGSRTLGDEGAFTPQSRYGASLLLSGKVYDFGRTQLLVRAASSAHAATQASARADRLELTNDVRAAYLAWLSAHESRRILERAATEARKLREMLEGRVAEGARPASELSLARYDEAQANLSLARADEDLATARAELEQITASHLPATAQPDPDVLERPQANAESLDSAKASALTLQKDAALANARAQRRGRAPVLAANLEAGIRGQSRELFPLYRAGLSLSLPLWDAGLLTASAQLAEAQAAEMSALATQQRQQAESEQNRNSTQLTLSERRLAIAKSMLDAARAELERNRAELELGKGEAELVVQANRRVAQAELEVLSARVTKTRAAWRLSSHAANEPQ